MARTNPDNKLKCDVAGFRGWMPTRFLTATGPDGTKYVQPGFKNVLTDEEHIGSEPPFPTGGIAHVRHAGDLYRMNYDKIKWEK